MVVWRIHSIEILQIHNTLIFVRHITYYRGVDYDYEKTEALKSYAELANCSVVINYFNHGMKLEHDKHLF